MVCCRPGAPLSRVREGLQDIALEGLIWSDGHPDQMMETAIRKDQVGIDRPGPWEKVLPQARRVRHGGERYQVRLSRDE